MDRFPPMNRINPAASQPSHKCPFCCKMFFLAQTLQSHKLQCILGKSLKRPPLTKPSSVAKQPKQQLQQLGQQRFHSKQKFRIKKIGNSGPMNFSSGDWKGKELSRTMMSTSKTGFSIVDRIDKVKEAKDSSMEKLVPALLETKQEEKVIKLDLSTKEKLFSEMTKLDFDNKKLPNSLLNQITEALINLEFEWPEAIEMYINQAHQIQQSISETDKKSAAVERLSSLRSKALGKIKQFLLSRKLDSQLKLTGNSSRVKLDRVLQATPIENQQYCFCTKCLGELCFGEKIMQVQDCGHRFHEECWKNGSTSCIGCSI